MDGFLFLLVSFMTLLISSNEGPIETSSLPQKSDMKEAHVHDSHFIILDENSKKGDGETADEENKRYDYYTGRSNHSRMLPLTTTIGYDEWWFYTTRISPISLKDFPGRPGVASWKEISRSSPVDRKSRKMNGPQAASVSSGSWSVTPNQITSKGVWMLLLICFCWT